MIISPDVKIVKTVSEVLIELDGKIDKVEQRLTRKIEAVDAKVDRVKDELTAEIKAVDAKVDRVKDELTAEIKAVDAKVDRVKDELTAEIKAVDAKVDRVKDELTAEIKAVDAKVDRVKDELTAEIRAVDSRLTGQIQIVQENQHYIAGQIEGISSQINFLTVLITILIGIAGLSAVIIPLMQKYLTLPRKAPDPAPDLPPMPAAPQK